jgi:hypothetical protein
VGGLAVVEASCVTTLSVEDPNCGLVLTWFKFLNKYGR